MSKDTSARNFFAFVSTGFATAVLIGLAVWQSTAMPHSSEATGEAGVAPTLVSDESVPAVLSETDEPQPSASAEPSRGEPVPVETPHLRADVYRDPLLPPRAYIAPERISTAATAAPVPTMNTFTPPAATQNRRQPTNRANPLPGTPRNDPKTTRTNATDQHAPQPVPLGPTPNPQAPVLPTDPPSGAPAPSVPPLPSSTAIPPEVAPITTPTVPREPIDPPAPLPTPPLATPAPAEPNPGMPETAPTAPATSPTEAAPYNAGAGVITPTPPAPTAEALPVTELFRIPENVSS